MYIGIYHNLLYFTFGKQNVHAVSNTIDDVKYKSAVGIVVKDDKIFGVCFNRITLFIYKHVLFYHHRSHARNIIYYFKFLLKNDFLLYINMDDTESPFDDQTFIRLMENILDYAHQKKNVIINAMGEADKETDPIPYCTLDCALCYCTYKEIKDDDTMEPEKQKLITRVKKNFTIMENTRRRNLNKN